ncbi:putative protein phosphatase 2C 40 [Senna tora]|uniref:Protein-serine/threonine phosphatase n=1 Tax=Senna tora TaxID=362788 RepID=A0A834WXS6_9FABA|nr:putative protein phosphatase 2C 40 [Senna tora]
MSASSRSDSFLNAMELQVAGGAAGEDRVQAVCSEENGWLFCSVYDGFNGQDAADFLAGTMYGTIICNFNVKASSDPSNGVVEKALKGALSKVENDFLYMVENEMEERPDLVSIGSCVLLVLLHGNDLSTKQYHSHAFLPPCFNILYTSLAVFAIL